MISFVCKRRYLWLSPVICYFPVMFQMFYRSCSDLVPVHPTVLHAMSIPLGLFMTPYPLLFQSLGLDTSHTAYQRQVANSSWRWKLSFVGPPTRDPWNGAPGDTSRGDGSLFLCEPSKSAAFSESKCDHDLWYEPWLYPAPPINEPSSRKLAAALTMDDV